MIYFLISLLPIFLFLIIRTKKSFHMLQQNWYNDGNRYLKWILKNPYKVFLEVDLFFIIFIVGLFIDNKLLMIFYSVFYIICFYLYQKRNKKEQVKKPLVFTKRVRRLSITTFLLYLISILPFFIFYHENHLMYYYLFISFIVYLNYFVVMTANFINKPWEKQVFYYYKRKATKKLKNMSNLEVIGITGSYGKTSSKIS